MGLGLTGEESVKLHEQLEVRVVALGCLSVAGPYVMTIKIDTYNSSPLAKFLLQ